MPTISGATYESRELSQAGAHRLDAVVRSICYSAHQGLHASSLRKQASLSGGEHTVNLRHDGGTLPYRRRDTLGRTRPHIADGKNAGPAGLKRQGGNWRQSGQRHWPGDHKPFVVHRNAVIEPCGVRVGANEQEEMTQGAAVGGSSRALAKHCCGDARDV